MNIYQKDYMQVPQIFTLIKAHQNAQAKEYLQAHPRDIYLKGWMDDTPLHIAVLSGNLEMVEYLVANGAGVNDRRTGKYATPLCWATSYEIAKVLLAHGATTTDAELRYATRADATAVVDLLLTSGAAVDLRQPQYLECKSIGCIEVYLKHGVTIDGHDEYNRNLLHKLVWQDLPEVFDFALQNGVAWMKDSGGRTPYYAAIREKKSSIVDHIECNYGHYIAIKIQELDPGNFGYKPIWFLKQSPLNNGWYALVKNAGMVKYANDGLQLTVEKAVEVNVPNVRNFTFDRAGNIIFPTCDNKLLVIDPIALELLDTIQVPPEVVLDQITFLPAKNIYIGSSENREIVLLAADFTVISRTHVEDGTLIPIVSEDENLIAFLSYNQETYFTLYHLSAGLSVEFVHTFFNDLDHTSCGFAFNNENEFVVCFPTEIGYYSYENDSLTRRWHHDISIYKPEDDIAHVVFIGKDHLVLGKGKRLLFIDTQTRTILRQQELGLSSEIRHLFFDAVRKTLLVVTGGEVIVVSVG